MDGIRMTVGLSREKSVLTAFALMLRYEIDISFKRTLLSVFPIHTKSKYQFQDWQSTCIRVILAITKNCPKMP